LHHLLYDEFVPWYRLLDPPEDHADEASLYAASLRRATPGARTLLELGAGAGHNALHLKRDFTCTLSDLSPGMLALSRELNPECEHQLGDMRSLRLGRTFDAVLVHDAIVYMTSERDLRAALETAFVHTRPGGAALIAPDIFREDFAELTQVHQGDDASRMLRVFEWMWDPDPDDSTYTVEYAFMMREGKELRVAHDRHVEGLFSRATWTKLLNEVGYTVETVARPVSEDYADDVFLCRKP
jgi:SAM-dependent methyltransferase